MIKKDEKNIISNFNPLPGNYGDWRQIGHKWTGKRPKHRKMPIQPGPYKASTRPVFKGNATHPGINPAQRKIIQRGPMK